LGYVFADTNDAYAIGAVGLSAVRWRARVTWTVDELTDEIGISTRSVANWRADFKESCQQRNPSR
jgi:hypothetical protein